MMQICILVAMYCNMIQCVNCNLIPNFDNLQSTTFQEIAFLLCSIKVKIFYHKIGQRHVLVA